MNDSTREPSDHRPAGPGPLFAGALVLLALLALTVLRSLPPEGLPRDAATETFSEARAREVLVRLLGDQRPHPVGSDEAEAIRARIIDEFTALGLRPKAQTAFACGGGRDACAPVVNLVARIPGRSERKAVLLTSHSDSVEAGPGASDAAAGVAAIVEVARALLAGPAPDRAVLLLISDGEEAGLLGARAFLEGPHAGDVFAVVNLEARGTAGPSALFETGPGNAALVSAWAREATRPVTSSTLYDLYKRLPNDTDLSVYKARGWPGLNFAFADGESRYHTPLDDLDHLDPRSLQHQGDNVLAAVRALSSLSDSASGGGDALWLDVLSFGVVSWPLSRNWPLLALAALLWATAAAICFRRRLVSQAEVLPALLGVSAALLLPQAAAFGVVAALQGLRDDPAPWTAHPAWATTAVIAAASGTALLVAALLARRAGAWAWWLASGLGAVLATAALAAQLPGAAALGLVPALGLNAALLCAGLAPRRGGTPLLLLGLVISAWPWIAIAFALNVMMGLSPVYALSVPVAVLATLLGVALPGGAGRWQGATAALLLAAVGFVGASIAPRYSRDEPRHANLVHLESVDSREAFWLVSQSASDELKAALARETQEVSGWPWPSDTRKLEATVAEPTGAAGARIEVLSRELTPAGRRLRMRLWSSRDARVATLFFPVEARLLNLSVEGIPRPLTPGEGARLTLRGLPRSGVLLELELETEEPATVTLQDQTPGLPPSGDRYLQARPPSSAPLQDGDRSVLYRRLILP